MRRPRSLHRPATALAVLPVLLGLLLITATAGTAAASTTTVAGTTVGSTTVASTIAANTTAAASTGTTTGFRFVDIPAADGAILKANVIEPTSAGRHPAIVFINSWGLNDLEYLAQAQQLATGGYTVLSYTTRGFWGSGGKIDTAGPLDLADSSTVVDWLIAHTTADPAHIGAAGVSYGAGIALISSAFDPRIRAVAALSGWTDLVESLYGGQTRRPQAVGLLAGLAQLFGTPSAELNQILSDYFANRNIDAIKAFARIRSAASYLDAINANRPAILMANAYGDSLFPPNQLVDFFGRLTTPKRLELAPGDHAVVEATGLIGLPNHVWTSVRRWFDQYLAGQDTGIGAEPPVVLRPRTSDTVESYVDWNAVTNTTQRYGLGAVRLLDGTGPLGGSATTGWSRTAYDLGDTTAGAGVALLTNGLEALTGIPPMTWLPSVDRVRAGVWLSGNLGSTAIRGIPRLHLTVKPGQPNGTVIAYLYDADATGTGVLIAHVPTTWLGVPTNAALGLDLAFPATAYTIPAGHRLALVVDGEDPLYLDANPFGAAITFTGSSWLDLPQR
jgi:predicted acyl esterase